MEPHHTWAPFFAVSFSFLRLQPPFLVLAGCEREAHPPQSRTAVLNNLQLNGYIAQWLERLTADQQVPGSNPGVPFQVYCNPLPRTYIMLKTKVFLFLQPSVA